MIVAIDPSARGEEAIEYCRGRMGGSMERKLPNVMSIAGNSSRMSRTESRLSAVSLSKFSSSFARLFWVKGQGELEASFEMF